MPVIQGWRQEGEKVKVILDYTASSKPMDYMKTCLKEQGKKEGRKERREEGRGKSKMIQS